MPRWVMHHGRSLINWGLACLALISTASADSGCAPYPIRVRMGNVTLDNNSTARGLDMSIGTPAQSFAFLPQWPLNNTMVYGPTGYCELQQLTWTEAGCTTFRGGEYKDLLSTTKTAVSSNAYPVDGSSYPAMSFAADIVKVNANTSLPTFPLGTAQNNWGEQGYFPQAAIGLGPNSTFLNALTTSGAIASRVYGMFWGRDGATSNTQLDGSMVFGGYDKAKVSGTAYTESLSMDRSACSTGMFVTITDMVLNFPNGTNASIFPSSKSASISACVVPSYPVLMTLPLDPYFDNFRTLTGASVSGRSFGVDFFAMRYDNGDKPYAGDLTIVLQNGLRVRVPNDQLVVPDRPIDAKTGKWAANSTDPTLVINAIQQVNANDLSQIGRQFLSAAYLMVNEETNQFTLWQANPTTTENLVAIDSRGEEATSTCVPAQASGSTSPAPINSQSSSPDNVGAESNGLSGGAKAGIAIGVVAAVGLVAFAAVLLLRRRKRPASVSPENPAWYSQALKVDSVQQTPSGVSPARSELDSTPTAVPSPQPANVRYELDPQSHYHYELMGSVPEVQVHTPGLQQSPGLQNPNHGIPYR